MRKFKEVLKAVAKQNNTTPDNVLKEMQIAIDAGYDNPDPDIQAQWSMIPHRGERPTAEEVIDYMVLQLAPASSMAN